MARSADLAVLATLLNDLFNAGELRRFAAQLPDIDGLLRELPDTTAPPAELVFALTTGLDRHGLIDAEFFNHLREARPRRRQEIDRVAQRMSRGPDRLLRRCMLASVVVATVAAPVLLYARRPASTAPVDRPEPAIAPVPPSASPAQPPAPVAGAAAAAAPPHSDSQDPAPVSHDAGDAAHHIVHEPDANKCPEGTRFIAGTGEYVFKRLGVRREIDDFCLDTTEVTVKAFRDKAPDSIAKSKTLLWSGVRHSMYSKWDKHCNARYTDRDDHPMNCVDWDQATAFCTGVGGRLPTEWEWEWAARGRDEAREYPWGFEAPDCDRAIFHYRKKGGCDEDRTWPVGYLRSELSDSRDGLRDMSGNVGEWTSSNSDSKDQKDGERVLRGGGWGLDGPSGLHAFDRLGYPPSFRGGSVGFRCVRTLL